MTTALLSDPSAFHTAAGKLFAEKPPVLVEVRFPNMGTSSDWFLCDDAAALDAILDRLGPGAEVHLHSVWDLKNPAGEIAIVPRSGIMTEDTKAERTVAGGTLYLVRESPAHEWKISRFYRELSPLPMDRNLWWTSLKENPELQTQTFRTPEDAIEFIKQYEANHAR